MRLDDHDVDAGQPLEVTIAGVNGYSSGDSGGRDEHVGERDQERVLAEEAVRVRRDAGLSDVIIAEATGAKPSTVRGWLSGQSSPTGERARRLAELVEITDRLARVVEPRYISLWLLKPSKRSRWT